ncbi:MAG: hypothetical protein Q9181_004197 [Wetmoreana brouardii]
MEKGLAHRAVIEPVGAPKEEAPKAPTVEGTSGEASNPNSPNPDSIPGNPNSQAGDPGGESDSAAIPGQPKKEQPQPAPKDPNSDPDKKEQPKPAPEDPNNDPDKEQPKPAPEDPNSNPNKNPTCKRGLIGRASGCSENDQELVNYYNEAERGFGVGGGDDDGESVASSVDAQGWPLSDDDAPTKWTEDLMKPYDENTYRADGVTAQRYLTGQIQQNPPSWRPFTEKYVRTETKNANPAGQLQTADEKNMGDIFHTLGIKYDQTVQDWNKVSMKSVKQNEDASKQGVVNRAWFSKSQKTIIIDEARKMYDGNEKVDRIPVSELNKQGYEEQAGDANFRWIVQPRVNGKGSKKAVKELFNKHGWSPDEWQGYDLSGLNRNSNIDPNSDVSVISGIDNVKTFERMAGGYGKQIQAIYIRGRGAYRIEPVIAIRFA